MGGGVGLGGDDVRWRRGGAVWDSKHPKVSSEKNVKICQMLSITFAVQSSADRV